MNPFEKLTKTRFPAQILEQRVTVRQHRVIE
jgi:hypothetical protein